MIAALTIPRTHRHPAWFLPILLPLLPFLGWTLGNSPDLTATHVGAALALLIVGLAVALTIPTLLDTAGPSVRKEVQFLRDPWLAAIFATQVPLLFHGTETTLEIILFATTAALVASIPFGGEFQQRTVAALLSQPVRRLGWWHLKSRILAFALALHTLIFLLSREAMGRPSSPFIVLVALTLAFTAFGTTPAWTLVTRSLIAGLVFSIAVPLLATFLVLFLLPYLTTLNIDLLWSLRAEEQWLGVSLQRLLLVMALPYAALGYRFGRERWLTLEAPDFSESTTALPRHAGAPSTSHATPGRRSRISLLLGKELRLQGVPLAATVVTLLLALGVRFTDRQGTLHDIALASLFLLSGATVVLAANTPIAEERRLGTLDSTLLNPVSRLAQWWLKLLVAIAIAMVHAAWVYLAIGTPNPEDPLLSTLEVITVSLVTLTFFAPAFLASSISNHPLRAVVTSVAAAIVLGTGAALTLSCLSDLGNRFYSDIQASIHSDTELWFQRAAAAANDPGLSQPPGTTRFWIILALLLPAPSVLALSLSARNFGRHSINPRQSTRQFAACAALWIATITLAAAVTLDFQYRSAQADAVRSAQAFLESRSRFSAVERLIWERFHIEPFSPIVYLDVTPYASERIGPRQGFALPLTPESRRRLIHRGRIQDDLREALRQEALRKGEDVVTPPPEPVSRIRQSSPSALLEPVDPSQGLSPRLRTRYGLVQPPNFPAPTAPETNATLPTP